MCFPYDICECRDAADKITEEKYAQALRQLQKWAKENPELYAFGELCVKLSEQ